jgi:hypothetical protein
MSLAFFFPFPSLRAERISGVITTVASNKHQCQAFYLTTLLISKAEQRWWSVNEMWLSTGGMMRTGKSRNTQRETCPISGLPTQNPV